MKRQRPDESLTATQRLAKARKVQNILDVIPQFRTFSSGDLQLDIRCFTSKSLPHTLMEWSFQLCKANMASYYQGVWGWDDKAKHMQLQAAASRFHVAFKAGATDSPLAYINYRLERDGQAATLYLYELQIAAEAQRRGVGQFLMALLEEQAKVLGLDKVMLTALDANEAAMKLYQKLGYSVDEDDPSNMDPPQKPGYTLLSKSVADPRTQPPSNDS